MKRLLLFTTILLLLYSCQEEPKSKEEVQSFEHQDIPLKEKIKKAVAPEYLNSIGVPENAHQFVADFYKKRSYTSRWTNDSTLTIEGLRLKNVLQNNISIGIPRGRIKYGKTDNFIQDEIWITVTSAQSIHDLKYGIIDFDEKAKRPVKCISVEEFESIPNFNDTIDIREQFIHFGPKDTTYWVLCRGLMEMTDRLPIDTSTFDIRSIKYDTTMAMEKTRIALVSKGYLKEGVIDSLSVTEALTVFQMDNGLKPDGLIGKFTSKSLNESTYRKIERIILAMDKIRSEREYPEKYIRINIPEYRLRFYINDSLKSDHNIVVGKYENQTPELESKLRKIVVYPYWNVPYSISSKEILPAVKYNKNYLAKHNYKIYKKGVEVDPTTVNWKSIRRNAFPFKVVQDPGPKNSLGIIKFDFYNKHSVYFHDTPAKGLFGADVRAYSHGCMRTQYPVDLAKAILDRDSIPYRGNEVKSDTLDSLLARGNNYDIKLIDPIPIYVDYVTVTREGEKMMVYLDVYGRDEDYLKILRE